MSEAKMPVWSRIRREIEWWRLTFVVIWRTVGGRWYVYRDMPDWLVFSHAGLEFGGEPGDVCERMQAMAQAEVKLRLDRLIRELERVTEMIARSISP